MFSKSHPIPDARIEIAQEVISVTAIMLHPILDAGIEIKKAGYSYRYCRSHPMLDAGIEISVPLIRLICVLVASHTRCGN